MNRHDTREKLVISVYQQLLLNKHLFDCALDNGLDADNDLAVAVLNSLIQKQEEYAEELNVLLNKWTFNRLGFMEQAILLVATAEIKETINDKAVVINEAITIAKKFCDEESYKYINGVLDRL